VEKALLRGDATEHTHRPALKAFIEAIGSGVTATNEPKREECGAPDLVISREPKRGLSLTIGYIEAKDVGRRLDDIEKSDQLKRYRSNLPNLILTDYIEFRWYVEGKYRQAARLARRHRDGRLKPEREGTEAVLDLLGEFLAHELEPIVEPRALAQRMARLTKMIHGIIVNTFEIEKASSMLVDLRKAFADALIPDLDRPEKIGEFADMYAQTIAYGLFAARCNHDERKQFQRLGAAAEIPKTNPFLRRLFGTITGPDLNDEPYVGFVDDLVALLQFTDMNAVLRHFGKRGRGEDPVIHFYETFLAAYDPKLRETRGVYYTPEPVVSYIVRSVDHLLKTRFDCGGGLADRSTITYEHEDDEGKKVETRTPRVLILDPACGTGTFLYAVVDHIREEFIKSKNAGMWSGYIKNHLLPRLFGFELLMAPYAVAHFKLGMQLAGQDLPGEGQRKKWAYDFAADERLGIYLTNTLEEAERRAESLLGPLGIITDEANAAVKIKRDLPIMVITGNPPYSGHSANKGKWIKGLLRGKDTRTGETTESYYEVDGEPLGERNPKWLQDDYVKFIRWAQWRIERTGAGILAFITNHSYLDSPTFRGMRQSLMKTFNEIYVLDLHGSAKKREKCPDGSIDMNVFDIQQGVAISIMTKLPNAKQPSRVFHADLWGLRHAKYGRLVHNDITNVKWKTIKPQPPFYEFVPQDTRLRAEYEAGCKVMDIFVVNSVGVVTARDKLTIRWTREEVWKIVQDFASLSTEEARTKYALAKDAKDWKVNLAQDDLRSSGPDRSRITKILYRPFDVRLTYYTGVSRGFMCRPRSEVMRHILTGKNLAITIGRAGQVIGSGLWDIVFCTRNITEFNLYRRGGNNLFPLYLKSREDDLLESEGSSDAYGGRRPNLTPEFIEELSRRLGLKFVAGGTGVSPVISHGQDGHATENTELHIRRGAYLPHWTKEGSTYFITFRLADSLPQSALAKIKTEQQHMEKPAKKQKPRLSAIEQKNIATRLSARIDKFLDRGAGACYLSNSQVAVTTREALFHFDGVRYRLLAWCIMPNHVHLLLKPLSGWSLADILHSIKSYSAKKANRLLGRRGPFWQQEYYDHIIRDEKEYNRLLKYISENPIRSGLEDWPWVGIGNLEPERRPDAGATDSNPTSTFGPEDIFNYIYAVLHAPTYRSRYAEFLKIDFPRVPLTSDVSLFRNLCAKGEELVSLHLLESPALPKLITHYPIPGDNLVEKGHPKYVVAGEHLPGEKKPIPAGRVYIGKSNPKTGKEGQYFDGVPPQVWEFHIGGYQVCEKWLKDRRGRNLSDEDLIHYQKIIVAIKETMRLMQEIDAAIPHWPLK